MLRIGIDARLYGVASGTGIGRYTEELLRQFSEAQDAAGAVRDFAFTVFLQKQDYDRYELPNDRWSKVLADFQPYSLAVQTRYPEIIRAARVDAMHFTHFDHPLRCPVPFAITIHDLILLHHHSMRGTTLGPLRFAMKYLAYRAVLSHAVQRSRIIFTPSQSVASEIVERFRIPSSRCIPTPLGIDHHTDASPQLSTRNSQPATPYALYIGNAYPHKRLDWLVRVWPEVTRNHPKLRLVLVIRSDPFTERLRRLACDRTHIVFVPVLTERGLRALLTRATCYVSPSACEGFNLPTAEAQAVGIPVIATDIPVHREVLGDGAAYYPVDDAGALARAIHRVLVDGAFRAMLERAGMERARAYTWQSCAVRTYRRYFALS